MYICRYEGVKNGPDAAQIRNDVQKEYRASISMWKARKARERAQNLIRGTPDENYALLPSYCHMLKQVNEGTYYKLVIDSSNRFKYVFISFGVCIRGFQHLRKVHPLSHNYIIAWHTH